MNNYLMAFGLLFIGLFAGPVAFGQQSEIPYGNNPEAGQYADVNGIRMYYESYGSGEPLLLLHGNGGSIKSHARRIEYFKNKYRVIAVDSRAHGKTADIGDSLTYQNMTADINALLEVLKLDSCYIWGQSDGGILGLKLAIDYPDKVKRLATFGANLQPDTSAVFEPIIQWLDETIAATTDPYTLRLYGLLKYQPNITKDELARVACPVLIMSGDRDVIRLEHSLKIFYNIKNSNLFIMPGATHFGSYEKAELFLQVLENFFSQPFTQRSTLELLK